MTSEQLMNSKGEEILRVAAEHGARDVRVFGISSAYKAVVCLRVCRYRQAIGMTRFFC